MIKNPLRRGRCLQKEQLVDPVTLISLCLHCSDIHAFLFSLSKHTQVFIMNSCSLIITHTEQKVTVKLTGSTGAGLEIAVLCSY